MECLIDQEVEKKPTIDLMGCVEIIWALVKLGHSLSVRRRDIFVAIKGDICCDGHMCCCPGGELGRFQSPTSKMSKRRFVNFYWYG